MTRHPSCDTRTQSTISGYRRICEDLELENQALRLQNFQMRALLARRSSEPSVSDAAWRAGCEEQAPALLM